MPGTIVRSGEILDTNCLSRFEQKQVLQDIRQAVYMLLVERQYCVGSSGGSELIEKGGFQNNADAGRSAPENFEGYTRFN